MKKMLLFLIPALLLFGCETQLHEEVHPPSSPVEDELEISLLNYFPQRQAEKFFRGIGNEYAQYSEIFYENEGPYFPVIMDNGGTARGG